MPDLTTLIVRIVGDATKLESAYRKAENDSMSFTQKVTSGLSSIGGVLVTGAAVAAGAAITGLGFIVKGAADEAMNAERAQAQLNAVLQSTGGAAGVTADMVNGLANQLSSMTTFEDDAIVSGESMLLTFTNIGKDVFPTATRAMLDMSQATGQDMKSSAIQLGKALNDPITGISALQRVGVTFTEEQQNMIKAMVSAGDVAGAQKMILEELNREFGGSAEAAGKTAAGTWERLKNIWGNTLETVGTGLLPILTKLGDTLATYLTNPAVTAFIEEMSAKIAQFAASAVDNIPRFIEGFRTAFDWLQNNQGVVVAILGALGTAVLAFGISVATAAAAAIAPLLPAIGVMLLVAGIAYILYEAWTNNWGGIREAVAQFWTTVQPYFDQLVQWLQVNVPLAIEMMSAYWKTTLQPALQEFFGWLASTVFPALSEFVNWLAVNIPAALQWLSDKTQAAIAFVQDVINKGMQFISDLTGGKLGWMSEVWNNTWIMITTIVNTFVSNVKLLIAAFQAAMSGDWYRFGELLRQVWDNTWKMIGTILSASWENFKVILSTAVTNVIAFFRDTDWGGVGKNIVQGIANGITNSLDWIIDAATQAAEAALDAAKGFLGINSPSRRAELEVGEPIGEGQGKGWIGGLISMIPQILQAVDGAMMGIAPDVNVSQRLSLAGAGVSASSKSNSGSIQIVVEHNPLISLGDRNEVEQVFRPILLSILRELGVEIN